jgi:hypothetical protein
VFDYRGRSKHWWSNGVREYWSNESPLLHDSITPSVQLLNMQQAEIIVLLLTAVAVLAVLAHKITLPYPIVLVVGGLALSFVPRLPPSLPALSGRRDGESCPVGPHRHGRGCCRRQNVSTDVPCVWNVASGLWPRGLDPVGKPTLRPQFPLCLPQGKRHFALSKRSAR